MDFSEILKNGTFRRFVVGASSAGVVVLNKKLNLGLEPTEVGELVLLALGYIVASNMTEVKKKGIEAAATVTTNQQAVDVLSAVKKTEETK